MNTLRMPMTLLTLLLFIATCYANAQLPPAPPAPPPDVNEQPSAGDVSKLLAEIQDVARWTKMAQDGDAFMLGNNFNNWTRGIIRLSRFDRRDEVDHLCDAMVTLHARLPANSVQANGNITAISFVRDAFRIGARHVGVVQYWVPQPYDSSNPNRTMLSRFSVHDGKDEVLRYHFEHSRRGEQDSYTLSKADAKTQSTALVQSYGGTAPAYWVLLRDVLWDIGDPSPPTAMY